MASQEPVQGAVGGKSLSPKAQTKIHEALKSVIQKELANDLILGTHTHGSIHISSWNNIFDKA